MDAKDMAGIIVGIFGAIPSYVIAWIKYREWVKSPNPPSPVKWLVEMRRSYPFLLGILFTIAMIVILLWPSQELEITITSPMDNAPVPRSITVDGYTNKELPRDEHLYIVVEYGGRWWPQYSEITPGYSPSNTKWEFSTPADIGLQEDVGKSFTIRSILVDGGILRRFQNWLRQTEWIGIPITDVNQWGRVRIKDSVTVMRR